MVDVVIQNVTYSSQINQEC